MCIGVNSSIAHDYPNQAGFLKMIGPGIHLILRRMKTNGDGLFRRVQIPAPTDRPDLNAEEDNAGQRL